jgi:hypothetical protein
VAGFGTLFKRSGVSGDSKPMHLPRKSCITDWAPSRVSPKSVQEWAGHAEIRTTMACDAKVPDSEFDKITGVTQKEEAGSGEDPKPAS